MTGPLEKPQLTPLPPSAARESRLGRKAKFSAAAAAIVAVVALVAAQANGDSGPSLRTAVATNRSVSKTLDEVGTVEPVSAASVAFPVAGRVATVDVAKGASVARGQTLATLDTTDLERSLRQAQAALAQAKLTLADAIAGDDSSSQNNSRVAAQADDSLAQARQAVIDGQQVVDQRISDAQAEYESAAAVCAAVTEETVADCQSSLSAVMAAQQATADAQNLLNQAMQAFDSAVEAQANAVQQTNAPSTPSVGSNTASAADLAAYQKSIDAAQAAVAVANQNLSAATIVSPIEGTIGSVNMAAGDAVAAASANSVIKIVGPNGYEVTAIVAVEKLANIKLGQRATVVPDGSDSPLAGEVVAIGAPRTSNGATSYPVSIGVDDNEALRNGSVASVSIVTGSAANGVAVPTSAVHTNAGQSTVNVVDGSEVKVVTVTVGVVGQEWTQIKSGVNVGDRVVLADLDEALPDSATSSNNNNNNGRNANVIAVPGGATFNGPPAGFSPPGR